MIVVNLMGGLGNQMFQFACGQSLGSSTGHEVRYAVDTLGAFARAQNLELERTFEIKIKVASSHDIAHLIGKWRQAPMVRRILAQAQCKSLRGQNYITEQSFEYIPDLYSKVVNGAYLHGYWQSEQYFARHADEIRRLFRFREDTRQEQLDVARKIAGAYSIGIHIRRGDYVTNAGASATHGVLPVEYYLNGVKKLRSHQPNARVFVFSDDLDWAADKFLPLLDGAECVYHNSRANHFRDMQLMAKCNALIIANSSFSWWAAWLNNRAKKIVIAPSKWFSDPRLNDSEILPESWIRG